MTQNCSLSIGGAMHRFYVIAKHIRDDVGRIIHSAASKEIAEDFMAQCCLQDINDGCEQDYEYWIVDEEN